MKIIVKSQRGKTALNALCMTGHFVKALALAQPSLRLGQMKMVAPSTGGRSAHQNAFKVFLLSVKMEVCRKRRRQALMRMVVQSPRGKTVLLRRLQSLASLMKSSRSVARTVNQHV